MRILRFLPFLIGALFSTHISFAQEKVDMADTMRSNGRIYVVVAVVVVILIGLILYLIKLDRKITKLEKENK